MQPETVTRAVLVYSGDTAEWPEFRFKESVGGPAFDLVADGWTSWVASWANNVGDITLELACDTTDAATGIIIVGPATSTQTRTMAGSGKWDLQATNSGTDEVRTFVRGTTRWSSDVPN